MKIYDMPQLTPEWWALHKGVPSASNFDKIITPKQRKYSAQARKYAAELIAQVADFNPPWLSNMGKPIRNTAMQNGVDTEPEARDFYSLERGVDVQQVGLCVTDDGRFCCSPDGLVGDDGGVELKCPLLSTHAEYLADGEVPAEYLPQVHGNLIVTGRAWWDFLSYAPGLPPLLIRVTPNDFTDELRKCLDRFWDEYQELRGRLTPNHTKQAKTVSEDKVYLPVGEGRELEVHELRKCSSCKLEAWTPYLDVKGVTLCPSCYSRETYG